MLPENPENAAIIDRTHYYDYAGSTHGSFYTALISYWLSGSVVSNKLERGGVIDTATDPSSLARTDYSLVLCPKLSEKIYILSCWNTSHSCDCVEN